MDVGHCQRRKRKQGRLEIFIRPLVAGARGKGKKKKKGEFAARTD